MRKQLTAEQQAKRDERRAKFKALWKQVADMPEADRIKATAHLGLVTCDGHSLSLCNSMLIVLQCPTATVLGGFRQWLKHGRAVRKGEHALMIWIPTGAKAKPSDGAISAPDATTETVADSDKRFLIGSVFDIMQTCEIVSNNETEKDIPSSSLEKNEAVQSSVET